MKLRIYYGTVNRVRKIGVSTDTVSDGSGKVILPYSKKPLKMRQDGKIIASKDGFLSDTIRFDYRDLKNSRVIMNLEEIK